MSELMQIALLGLIAAAFLWFGYIKNFFQWTPRNPWESPWDSKVYLKYVLLAFAIYFGTSNFIAPIYLIFLRQFNPSMLPIGLYSWLNFANSATILLFFAIVWRCLPLHTRHGIVRCETVPLNLPQDFKMGLFAWVLSFPLVIFLTTFFEWLVISVFKVEYIPDQLAVEFVKMTFAEPFYFALTILSVVFITPFVEETLFRGFLQSFVRRHLGSTQAILITSLCFAFFHYSPEQGIANIPIVGTLFALALFLGFLYEKQGSLFASISLHALFNGISILNLYFLGRIPCFF